MRSQNRIPERIENTLKESCRDNSRDERGACQSWKPARLYACHSQFTGALWLLSQSAMAVD